MRVIYISLPSCLLSGLCTTKLPLSTRLSAKVYAAPTHIPRVNDYDICAQSRRSYCKRLTDGSARQKCEGCIATSVKCLVQKECGNRGEVNDGVTHK